MLSHIDNLSDYARQISNASAPLDCVQNAITEKFNIDWRVLRLDLLDAELSGNKLFKLLPFLQEAQQKRCSSLVSFGGAHSNHLYALAAAGKRFGFNTVGIVRAYPQQPDTETLSDLRRFGMHIRFADKQEYARRYEHDYLQQLTIEYPSALVIPEGGASDLGVKGATLMADLVERSLEKEKTDILALSAGTGTSFLGLLQSQKFINQTIHVYPALNDISLISRKVKADDNVARIPQSQWRVFNEYHGGGFAKMNESLARFIIRFEEEQGISLDPVYTAKLFYAIETQIRNGFYSPGTLIVSLHTGGLQGSRGMRNKIHRLVNHFSRETMHEYA